MRRPNDKEKKERLLCIKCTRPSSKKTGEFQNLSPRENLIYHRKNLSYSGACNSKKKHFSL